MSIRLLAASAISFPMSGAAGVGRTSSVAGSPISSTNCSKPAGRVRDKEKALFWYRKTKELDCQFVGIDEFETLLRTYESRPPVRWTIMGYEIFIRRGGGTISLSEWQAAVAATDGVRLHTADTSITNPKTGEIISIRNSGGDAEIHIAEISKWVPAFHWRATAGDVSIPFSKEFSDRSRALRIASRQLALKLNARLIGEGGEVYE